MKTRFLHIVNGALLFLILLYSTPVSWLHSCDRFNPQHHEATVTADHADCYWCDLQLSGFMAPPVLFLQFLTLISAVFLALIAQNILSQFQRRLSNKGPPAAVLI